MDIDQEIEALEVIINCVPGTIIQRTLKKEGTGLEWTLGLGCLQEPKTYFTGDTIKECVQKAKKSWGEPQ